MHHLLTRQTRLREPFQGETGMKQRLAACLWASAMCVSVPGAAQQTPATGPEIHIPSTIGNIIRGQIPANRPPVVRVKPGQTVVIDTLSHQGVNTASSPVEFFGKGGIKPEEVLKDHIDMYGKV